jgi:8-oxo-dGTP pyrophosphatase MutT (NUDIX family)
MRARLSIPSSLPFALKIRPEMAMQAAAVCFRARETAVEFLLVNTSSGKWTFPKGRIEPHLTGSESAALEAWEEAGAKGQIESAHFAWYLDTKRTLGHDNRTREILIATYLFEVHRTVAPKEGGRNPSWFMPREARLRLAEMRPPRYADLLEEVVDAAVKRIRERHVASGLPQHGRLRRLALR